MSAMKKMVRTVVAAVVLFVTGAGVMAGPIFVESVGHRLDEGVVGHLYSPMGVAVDSVGSVYVADRTDIDPIKLRIVKFTPSVEGLSQDWSFETTLPRPWSLAMDSAGNVYVAGPDMISKFSQSGGTLSLVWSTHYGGNTYLSDPQGVAVDGAGDLYVTAGTGGVVWGSVVKFSQPGASVIHEWVYNSGGRKVGVAVDAAGNVYVTEPDSNRIRKLTQSGGSVVDAGTFNEGLLGPLGVAVDAAGYVYVADTGNYRVLKYSPHLVAGQNPIWSVGSYGTGVGQFVVPRALAVDSRGSVFVADASNLGYGMIKWWFDVDGLPAGQIETLSNLTLWADPALGSSLTLDSGRTLHVLNTMTVEAGRTLTVSGATVNAGQVVVAPGGVLNVGGSINGAVTCGPGGKINITGDAALGDATRYDGFTYDGALSVGAHTVTLHARGFVNLGVVTEISGGTLAAPNGVVIGSGRALAGSGTVAAKVSAGFGSTIEATGALSLGDVAAYDGFYGDGTLLTGRNAVTIYDRNAAVLGSLTQLGDGAAGGTLTAGRASPGDTQAHFLLEQGKNMVGRGSVNGNFKNHGDVIGDGVADGERIIFNSPWIVSGKGTFTNTLIMGTFAPGESPGITNGTNQGFGGTVQIELGGTVPGFGNDKHDQINDAGTILLLGSSTLKILPWNGFVPKDGDEFIILTWQAGLDGTFGGVVTDSWFTDRDISFVLHYNNIGGAGNLTIEAIPEPATLSLLALLALRLPKRGGLAVLRRYRK